MHMQISLGRKIKKLTDIRHELKKHRFILDESKEKFGADSLIQLKKVKNTSEVKGYPFKLIKDGVELSVKILPIETKYEKNEHPCYIENIILKELTDNIILKGVSPHIAYYIGSQRVNIKSKALDFLNLRKLEVENKIKNTTNMLISEYVSGGSLNQWVYDVYERKETISDEQWRSIVFQLLYTISVLQHHYRMMHNDFHYGNILIDDSLKPGGYFVYTINGEKYYIKNNGIIPKLWDFEFSMVYSNKIKDYYPNKFITGPYTYDKKTQQTILDENINNYNDDVPYNYNTVYDVHYFLTSLLDLYISQELFDWIMDIYPDELIPDDTNTTTNSTNSSSQTSDTNLTTDLSGPSSISKTTSNTSLDSKNSNSDSNSDSLSLSTSETDLSLIQTTDIGSTAINESNSSTQSVQFLKEGRMLNGVEKNFKLPDANSLINNKFFSLFKTKPEDFNESNAIFLNAGF